MKKARERREMEVEEDEEEGMEVDEDEDEAKAQFEHESGASQGESIQMLNNIMKMMEEMRDNMDQMNARLLNLESLLVTHAAELQELFDLVQGQQRGGVKEP